MELWRVYLWKWRCRMPINPKHHVVIYGNWKHCPSNPNSLFRNYLMCKKQRISLDCICKNTWFIIFRGTNESWCLYWLVSYLYLFFLRKIFRWRRATRGILSICNNRNYTILTLFNSKINWFYLSLGLFIHYLL